jgi:hypothetical protein
MPYYCNTATAPATCVQPASVGEDCTTITCDTGLYCQQIGPRVCATSKPDGAACQNYYECLSNDCGIPAGGTSRVCIPGVVTAACIGR